MNIKPWNKEIQPLGPILDEQWSRCENQFLNLFRNANEIQEDDAYDVDFSFGDFVYALLSSFQGKQESLTEYINTTGEIIRTISIISERIHQGSFDSEEEDFWFGQQITRLQSRLQGIAYETSELTSTTHVGPYEERTLSMFFIFHSSLKELSKYCLLRMDVERVQRKLVARALDRIDGALWQSIRKQGRGSIREFLRQSNYRYATLNRLRSVLQVNHNLEVGIIYADKAYTPQASKNKGNIQIKTIQSLTLDLGDNDILKGAYSLDRNIEGFIAQESSVAESPVIVAYKGTDFTNGHDLNTDCVQALTCVNDVYLMALGLLLYVRDQVGSSRTIRVYGHSLGGGLMQFAVSSAPSGRTYGYGYNSAGLSSGTMRLIPQPMHIDKIRHFRVRKDWVMATGEQIGIVEQYDNPVCNIKKAHETKTIRNILNKITDYVNIK